MLVVGLEPSKVVVFVVAIVVGDHLEDHSVVAKRSQSSGSLRGTKAIGENADDFARVWVPFPAAAIELAVILFDDCSDLLVTIEIQVGIGHVQLEYASFGGRLDFQQVGREGF